MSAASARGSADSPRRPASLLAQCAALAARDLALQRSYRASLALGLVSAGLGLLSYHFVGRLIAPSAPGLFGRGYFAFVCSGVLLQAVVAAALGGLGGALAREARDGTLEPALLAGCRPTALVVGAAATPVLLALVQTLGVGALGLLFLDAPVDGMRAAAALFALALTVLACTPLGLLGAAAWVWMRRPGAVTTLAGFAFGFFGGVYFPIELLPGPLPGLARWIPVGAGLEAIRASLLGGAGVAEVLPAFGRLALIAALGLPASSALLRLALRRARRRGTLLLV